MEQQKEFNTVNRVRKVVMVILTSTFLLLVVVPGLYSLNGGDYILSGDKLTRIKHLQNSLELFKDSCGGYPVSEQLVDISQSSGILSYSKGCPVGVSLASFIDTSRIPLDAQKGRWYFINRDITYVPYKYCSTTSSVVPQCVNSSESYVIPFVLNIPSGSLPAGPHIATPEGIK